MKILTRTIWIISLVSLFTDISSEMLYPFMPIFLKNIGFSVVLIGVLEGFAEALAGFSKGYFGKRSDVSGKRLPFVQLGYFMSAIAKPMMAIFTFPVWIFTARALDRLGKGVRTSARDAILSAETTPEHKAKVFGFHRGMDTLGAVLGPVLALIFLSIYPENYRLLFFVAFVPALLGVGLTMIIKEKPIPVKNSTSGGFFSFLNYWKEAEPDYRKLVGGLLAFTLINSSDAFLLLMAKNRGLTDQNVIVAYILFNLTYALTSFPLGILGDKFGLKRTLIGGLIAFAGVYSGMAFVHSTEGVFALFLLYGLYYAGTEGVSKAWITNLAPKESAATAVGFYTGMQSIFTLVASTTAGALWLISPEMPFIVSAICTLLIVAYFILFIPTKVFHK